MIDRDGRLQRRIPSGDLALGIVRSEQLSLTVHTLEELPGSRLILYSDGIIEATNEEYDVFGDERLLKALERAGDEVIEEVRNELERFRGDHPQSDDITLVELRLGKDGRE